ncbi:MAG: DegQ family serine endoprotease [Phycisphaerales bacterium]
MAHALRSSVVRITALAVVGAALSSAPSARADTPPAPSREAKRAIEMAEGLSQAFEHVANVVTPSVVTVQAARRIEPAQRRQQIPDAFRNSPFGDEFFERFFGGPAQPRQPYVQQGQGTGFIVSEDGYILTNNHVVAGATELRIVLSDDSTYDATIVGTDPQTDVAVLKVEASGLPALAFGDSDDLRVGQWVVAAGSPLGLSSTITAGIVSATGRSRVGLTDYEDFIQTDAAINPGNSGGPLVNLRGEVVGMNTAIATRTGGNMGIGFAIPINMAAQVMHSLIDNGAVTRGWLGVVIQDLTPGLAESFGFEGDDGVLISEVTPDGPAAKAGLEAGDIVTAFNGQSVESMDALRLKIAATEPGSAAEFRIFRNGDARSLSVEIGRLGEPEADAPADAAVTENLGLNLQDLTPEFAGRLGLPPTIAGALVTGVDPTGHAARAGLRPRDVIVGVQGRAVEGVDALRTALAEQDLERGVRLTVITGGRQRFIFLRVPD